MVIDTCALVAVLLEEPLSDTLGPLMLSEAAFMASPSYLEAYMVLTKHYGARTQEILNQKVADFGIQVVPFTPEHAQTAALAFALFGKGRHPAGLNYGDCISYALAKSTDQTLLFVGEDFHQTDIRPAILPQ